MQLILRYYSERQSWIKAHVNHSPASFTSNPKSIRFPPALIHTQQQEWASICLIPILFCPLSFPESRQCSCLMLGKPSIFPSSSWESAFGFKDEEEEVLLLHSENVREIESTTEPKQKWAHDPASDKPAAQKGLCSVQNSTLAQFCRRVEDRKKRARTWKN